MSQLQHEFGYSQMKFNYITDYASFLHEQAVQMEMAWQNRNNFGENVDIEKWIDGKKREIEQSVEEFKNYLQPLESFKKE